MKLDMTIKYYNRFLEFREYWAKIRHIYDVSILKQYILPVEKDLFNPIILDNNMISYPTSSFHALVNHYGYRLIFKKYNHAPKWSAGCIVQSQKEIWITPISPIINNSIILSPINMTKLISIILHELAHVIQFNCIIDIDKVKKDRPYCFEESFQFERVAEHLARKLFQVYFPNSQYMPNFNAYLDLSSIIDLYNFNQNRYKKIPFRTKLKIVKLYILRMTNFQLKILM